METLIEGEARVLCRVDDIADGGTMGFPPAPGGFSGLLAWRNGEDVRVYVNSCPHIGTPLDWMPDVFLSRDRQHIVCATHGALFSPKSGECTHGPCKGDYLDPVKFEVRDGVIHVPANAGL